MRLVSIELSGFRGFAEKREFDLDADAIVVVGSNGHGKTSLFDGILWALSGRISRLQGDDSRLISMYTETGQARVALKFRDYETAKNYVITRSFDGAEKRVTFETPTGSYKGASAEGALIEVMWPDAASASDSGQALADVLTRSVYLQQDLVRQFVDATSPQERFAAVSELVGAGRVTELQDNLERSKKAWTTVTNQRQEELRALRDRLAAVEARLSELTGQSLQSAEPISTDEWAGWWSSLLQHGLKIAPSDAASREAPSMISNAIKELDALRRLTERKLQTLEAIKTEIKQMAQGPLPDLDRLRGVAETLRKGKEEAARIVTQEQSRLAESRRHQAELRERDAQLKALADLALRNLGDHCPVCAQTYDQKLTRERLEKLSKTAAGPIQDDSTATQLAELLNALTQKEKEVASAELALRSAEQLANQRKIVEETLVKQLRDLGLESSANRESAIVEAISETKARAGRLGELQQRGESLALRLAQSSASARVEELRRERDILRDDVAERMTTVTARMRTGDLAQKVIEALREGASAVVQERLNEINPLLQNIWTRIDPHPTFRVVSFLSQIFRGKGQLSTVLTDAIESKESEVPAAILSSSQVNALAVSVFLALNLGIQKPPLAVAILDDPLQSLDDINLLGLTDLFRRTKDRRQLLVSTHDARFGVLLSRKLRPRDDAGRTLVTHLDTWNRLGPTVTTQEIKCDPVPIRLVS